MKTFLAILCGLGLALASEAAQTPNPTREVRLEWTPNPDTISKGFIVYWGTATRNYTSSTNVGAVTNCALSGLAPGSNYVFAVTSYDASGEESEFSNEVAWTAPARPKPPILRITGILQAACNVQGPWDDVTPFGEFLCEAEQNQYYRVVLKQELLP